ncbi:MAG: hybrid sensor histidine kinase/response regulator [Sulfuritalea sp.]|jgi:two-component system chemotaxis sensor kinase CheA|nr:hybrid sensor histidine kinase/response regulator [Sulfuritalea sp.]
MIEDQELHRLFKAESEEHLARLDDGLLRLEKTPADQPLLEEVFRESHSLKGAARMLGLAGIEAAAHGLESIFNAARKGEAPLTPETIESMNAALGDLRRHVREALADERQPPAPAAVSPAPTFSTVEASVAAVPPAPTFPASEASVAATPPAATAAPPPAPSVTPAAIPAATGEAFRIETVRVETRKLDDLLTQVGELSVIDGRAQHRLGLMEELLENWAALERGRRKRGAVASARNGEEGTAPMREADASLRFGALLKQARDALFDDSTRLESVVKLLEDQVRSVRLLPLSTVFALFPRMVRDLAKAQGKEAKLEIEGGDITVDKRILEEMKDPLMHLLRNAIDHGVEPPVERERLGKPRCATVRLRAVRDNANVLLEVHDDGRGLDPAAIRQEAKKRGLFDEATLAAMTPAQVQQLILMPGFSTSTYVTELSGRGVGLDVVRVNVERMKGGIRLESSAGQGLTVALRLPLSLATTRLLLANAGGRLYGLPVEFVHTSRRVRETDLFTLEGRLAILFDGQPVIAARIKDLLELPPAKVANEKAAAPDILACIVLQVGDERLALLADDLPAEEEVVPKPLGAPLKRVRNVSALAMLGSGEICVVLNPADLLRSAHRAGAQMGNAPEGLQAGATAARTVVLLVEDSALIRAMEQRILEDGGYEVVTAVDGVDALNALGGRSFAAVVSDIMMPNMDGLALTTHIRAEARYRELPVILVTTLASDEDKRRGLDAGANAYIPKPSFDQRVLLDTLKRLVVK